MNRKLEAFSQPERENPNYYIVCGLIKKTMGDPTAIAAFEKALVLSPTFVEARREINALQSVKAGNTTASEFFNGDLTSIVSQIFKKKIK